MLFAGGEYAGGASVSFGRLVGVGTLKGLFDDMRGVIEPAVLGSA